MRKCSKCLNVKPLSEFYPKRRKLARNGYNCICKECAKHGALEWARDNLSRHNKKTKLWASSNKEKHAESVAKWAKANLPKRNQCCAARRASKKSATPPWGNEFFMDEIYDLAKRRTKVTGFKWHVDHIVPLQSKLVCGLHVEHNLQVIPASENLSKHNRLWPDMPS